MKVLVKAAQAARLSNLVTQQLKDPPYAFGEGTLETLQHRIDVYGEEGAKSVLAYLTDIENMGFSLGRMTGMKRHALNILQSNANRQHGRR